MRLRVAGIGLQPGDRPILLVDVEDPVYTGEVSRIGSTTYDEFVASGGHGGDSVAASGADAGEGLQIRAPDDRGPL